MIERWYCWIICRDTN